eukprot:3178728-Pleurochrysis_carterae.AAC.1
MWCARDGTASCQLRVSGVLQCSHAFLSSAIAAGVVSAEPALIQSPANFASHQPKAKSSALLESLLKHLIILHSLEPCLKVSLRCRLPPRTHSLVAPYSISYRIEPHGKFIFVTSRAGTPTAHVCLHPAVSLRTRDPIDPLNIGLIAARSPSSRFFGVACPSADCLDRARP